MLVSANAGGVLGARSFVYSLHNVLLDTFWNAARKAFQKVFVIVESAARSFALLIRHEGHDRMDDMKDIQNMNVMRHMYMNVNESMNQYIYINIYNFVSNI